jgi:hypothetical protein
LFPLSEVVPLYGFIAHAIHVIGSQGGSSLGWILLLGCGEPARTCLAAGSLLRPDKEIC